MRVIDLINSNEKTAFSFEILPPLKGTGIEKLYQTIDTLREFDPKYINITTHRSEYVYKDLGNGLFQRNRLRRRPGTVAVAAAIQNKYNITMVPHILCSGFTREETEYVLLDLQFLGITDLLVLRGDKAKHESSFIPVGNGYHHAVELQEQINNFNKGIFVDGSEMKVTNTPFSYGVACYPEKHEEAPNIDTDIYWLKKKMEAGAEYAVTQLFYDNQKYFDFVERARKAGVTIPIIPGIKPFKKISQISMIPKTFKVDLPEELAYEAMKCKTDEEAKQVGIEWCVKQCKELVEHGVPSIHFYSIGAGWLMSEEEFMKDITWLDMLKLKGSWGTLGNQNLDKAYPAEPLLTNAYSAVFGKPSAIYPGYQLSYLPNPNLRWEKVEAWEAGAEANFFRNRLHFEGVYYKKTTKDLLAEVPGISGTVPGIGNLGSIENKGVELAINWRDQIGDWGYNVGANLTTIKNKVLSLVQDGYSIIAGDKSQSYTMAGYPIGYFYGYKVEGVYQTDEEIAKSPKNTLATVTPGDLKFKDVNGDGEITTADRTMIGDPTPDVTYGITLGVNYKNWELGIDMMGQGGNQIFRTWDNYNWSQFNFMEQRMDRWHGPGTSNTQPLLNTKHTINNLNSEYYIEDGSFFRIRNVQLAYNFDKTLISRIGMQALKLYVNIQNLKTWKHNTGYTPELGGSAIAFGVDDGSYPMPAIYTFGFNLTF